MGRSTGYRKKEMYRTNMKKDNPAIYKVKRFLRYKNEWWKETMPANVDVFPWPDISSQDYRPATCAWVGTDGLSLFVYMETDETDIRAETKGFGYVHTDSCMEFFLEPAGVPSQKYLNFEFNPIGSMYLSIGTHRHDRIELRKENFTDIFQIKTKIFNEGWNLEYKIPLFFLKTFFPALEFSPGCLMRGNFYKCGDNTARPHFGCWSPIGLLKPDFHCPEFFGVLELM